MVIYADFGKVEIDTSEMACSKYGCKSGEELTHKVSGRKYKVLGVGKSSCGREVLWFDCEGKQSHISHEDLFLLLEKTSQART